MALKEKGSKEKGKKKKIEYGTIRAHVIELDPTDEQTVYLKKACGTARFA